MRFKRLLIVNDYGLFGGGTENRIRLLVEKLLEDKIFQEVHILQKFSLLSEQKKEIAKYPSIFIHIIEKKNSFFTTNAILKKYKIDLVQCHNLLAVSPWPIVAAKIHNIPVVFFGHDYWPICGYRSFINPRKKQAALCPAVHTWTHAPCLSMKAKIRYVLWKKIMNFCSLGIATGQKMIEIYEQNALLKGKWEVVVPWLNPSFFSSTKKSNFCPNYDILFVGSLMPFKGAFVAVNAMEKINESFPQARLFIIGSEQELGCDYRKDIEEIITHKNVKNIYFLGKKSQEEIRKYHKKISIFVCPTRCMESFGLTWAEAMADGCCVIASNISTLPEYIDNGKNGMLVPPNDSQKLAEAVMALFKSPVLQKQILNNGIKYARENFDRDKAYQHILHYYSRL